MRPYLRTLLVIISTLSLFSGCSKQPKPEPKVQIDPTLPTPVLNGHISDMNAIAFEWQSIEDARVKGYYVYRSLDAGEKLQRYATVKGTHATHYVDNDLSPDQTYAYRFSTFNDKGIESRASKTYRTGTLPLFKSVSFFTSIGNMPRSAKLIWRPHTDVRVKSYRIERKLRSDAEWSTIASIYGRLNAEYIDDDLDDNQIYNYRIYATTFEGIESSPSETVTVVTKPLPDPITNIKVTQNLPRAIRISWDASQRENFEHYNIYRATSANGSFQYHVKLHESTFSDRIEDDGARYYYKVTAVDSDGLESKQGKRAYVGTTLAKPATPQQIRGNYQNGMVRIRWIKGDDNAASYTVIKTKKEGWFEQSVEEFPKLHKTNFADGGVSAGSVYAYKVVAVNQYGIRSEPSEAVEISIEAQ